MPQAVHTVSVKASEEAEAELQCKHEAWCRLAPASASVACSCGQQAVLILVRQPVLRGAQAYN